MGDRKARLAALAAKAGRTKKGDGSEIGDENDRQDFIDEKKQQSLSFRNYAPSDDSLDRKGEDFAGAGAGESPTKRQRAHDAKPSTSALVLQEALQQAKQEIESNSQGKASYSEDSAAERKKINWDLKRDIHDKLNKLEKRTQKAIVEMLKERLEKEAAEQADSGESDLD